MALTCRWVVSQLLPFLAVAAAVAETPPPTPTSASQDDSAIMLPAMNAPMANGCQAEQFRCTTSTKCIPMESVCDGKINCPDSSDEPASCIQCRLSEFRCGPHSCIPLARFCDGNADCVDKLDEPPFCTPCNRTYYGDVDQTYDLEIRRPREDRLPFICFLNFTAAGGNFGDLVQLTFDTFTVGKFVSFTTDGCPDGAMSVQEEGRPPTGGSWCGSAWGYTVFYSETRSLNVSLRLARLSEQGIGYNFDLKLAYKFLRRSSARLRYGNSTVTSWRGDLVPGTYCDRILEKCDVLPCRVQSPNYPGVYPRNATCRYLVRQRSTPPGKHALIAVRQRAAHKVHIKYQVEKHQRSQRVLKVWDECNVVQDYLTVHDGDNSSDPILVRLCGGDSVPEIVSSGPKMLLEFHTSPFDSPYHPAPLSYLPGFELEVQVMYVDARSATYVKDRSRCEFHITSFENPWGVLQNPRHSLPPNTTCRYHFQGKHRETVWLSFIKYHAFSTDPTADDTVQECNSRMRVWDGRVGGPFLPVGSPPVGTSSGRARNATLLGEFCRDSVPRLCAHALLSNESRTTRPCSPAESYVSSGQELTLEVFLKPGSALYPLSFALRYEFVDTVLEGARDGRSANPCDRVFSRVSGSKADTEGRFQSPRSVFFYGRGGAQNLSCSFRFEAAPDERVRISIIRTRFGDRPCSSKLDERTGRWECSHSQSPSSPTAELWVAEYPWPQVQVARDCLCSTINEPLVIGTLTSTVVEVNFSVTQMNVTEDYDHFYFEAKYEFIDPSNAGVCESGTRGSFSGGRAPTDRILSGISGELALRNVYSSDSGSGDGIDSDGDNSGRESAGASSDLSSSVSVGGSGASPTQVSPADLDCVDAPWLIEPQDLGHFLYLKVRGRELQRSSASCPPSDRVVVRSALEPRSPRVFCGDRSASRVSASAVSSFLSGGITSNDLNDDGSTSSSFHEAQLFSAGWNARGNASAMSLLKPYARAFVVEVGPGIRTGISWLQLTRHNPPPDVASTAVAAASSAECTSRCPELNGCIDVKLWCDGNPHCPSGFDESPLNCSFQFGFPALYLVMAAGCGAALFLVCAVTGCIRACRRQNSKRRQQATNNAGLSGPMDLHKGKMLGPPLPPLVSHKATSRHVHVNHLHSNGGGLKTATLSRRYPTTTENFYFDGKDSLC